MAIQKKCGSGFYYNSQNDQGSVDILERRDPLKYISFKVTSLTYVSVLCYQK